VTVTLHSGPRAAESAVLKAVEALLGGEIDLGRPVRVIVPSGTLRAHLSSRLVAHCQRPLAGVLVQTLWGAALEIHERYGEAPRRGDFLFEILVERLAREEDALREPLEGLADGFRAVHGTVRDLLDAGLEPELARAAEDVLALHGAQRGERDAARRGAALVRVAAGMDRVLAAVRLERSSTILRRARELLQDHPTVLPSRAVIIHGFADATGRAGDLLQALLQSGDRESRREMIFDLPPDPALSTESAESIPPVEPTESIPFKAPESAFATPLLERMGATAPPRLAIPPMPRIERFCAPGTEAEVEAIAHRLRRLLDENPDQRPEAIAVVARDLTAYRLPLTRHLRRLGIPFSGYKTPGGQTTAGRTARALLEILDRRGDLPTDRWLDARQSDLAYTMELRLALRAAGAGRLRVAARLEVDRLLNDRGRCPLPLRQGLMTLDADEENDDSPGGARAHRRTLDGGALRRAVAAAQALLERLESWPENDTAENHLARLEALLRQDLAWSEAAAPVRPLLDALAEARRQVPGALALQRPEVGRLVAAMLREVGRPPLGGRGGGVQLLTVTEARALTFDHLFLLGMNRDVFPRPIREDPLLSDALRHALQAVLPEIPIKRRGFEEERYLFAQLLAASPRVTLSWQTEDDEGTARSPSPLVERLRWGLDLGEAPAAEPPAETALRPALDRALIAGLAGGRGALRPVYPFAVAEGRREFPPNNGPSYGLDPTRLAAVRLRLLDEVDPDRSTPEGRRRANAPGPYQGFLGPLATARATDPRRRPLYVTLLERLAGCPWQTFVTRLLGIEPMPDPLQALPGIDRLLLGDAVHAVLEKILEESLAQEGGTALAETLARQPVAVPWPSPPRLDALLKQESERILRAAGMPLPGLARALARRVRPFLEVAQRLDFATPLNALGAEVEGTLTLTAAGLERSLHFRADRVDRHEGLSRLTDYKTGKPVSEGKKEATRRRHLLQKVTEGSLLQTVTYLLAGGESQAEGRYLFLREDLDDAFRDATTQGAEADLVVAFQGAVEAILAAWDAGTFFPRLTDPAGEKEPSRCGYCPVAEACLRLDSGARRRLVEVATEGTGGEAMGGLWGLAGRTG
jgi:hypothetical protein